MLENVLERASEKVSDTAHRASRISNVMSEAFEDGVGMAKRVVKHGSDAAEEFMEDTQQRIKRHPIETVVAAFAMGAAAGLITGWVLGRK